MADIKIAGKIALFMSVTFVFAIYIGIQIGYRNIEIQYIAQAELLDLERERIVKIKSYF